jgi:hypothetical protein
MRLLPIRQLNMTQMVLRLNTNGSVDASFHFVNASRSIATDMVVLEDNRILVTRLNAS